MPTNKGGSFNLFSNSFEDQCRNLYDVCLAPDHGRGIYSIMVGSAVNGGVYGQMFPVAEAQEKDGAVPLQRHGADITGAATAAIEPDVSLSGLLS